MCFPTHPCQWNMGWRHLSKGVLAFVSWKYELALQGISRQGDSSRCLQDNPGAGPHRLRPALLWRGPWASVAEDTRIRHIATGGYGQVVCCLHAHSGHKNRPCKPRTHRLVDRRIFFPGWHMNKRTWYTILFDRGLDFEELCARLARSRRLALRWRSSGAATGTLWMLPTPRWKQPLSQMKLSRLSRQGMPSFPAPWLCGPWRISTRATRRYISRTRWG